MGGHALSRWHSYQIQINQQVLYDLLVDLMVVSIARQMSGSYSEHLFPGPEPFVRRTRYEIPFFTVSSERFERSEEELLAYEAPITRIIEQNSVRDLQEIEDRRFAQVVERAQQAVQDQHPEVFRRSVSDRIGRLSERYSSSELEDLLLARVDDLSADLEFTGEDDPRLHEILEAALTQIEDEGAGITVEAAQVHLGAAEGEHNPVLTREGFQRLREEIEGAPLQPDRVVVAEPPTERISPELLAEALGAVEITDEVAREGMAALGRVGADFIRQRLGEESFSRRIVPPQVPVARSSEAAIEEARRLTQDRRLNGGFSMGVVVPRADEMPSVVHDTRVELRPIEPGPGGEEYVPGEIARSLPPPERFAPGQVFAEPEPHPHVVLEGTADRIPLREEQTSGPSFTEPSFVTTPAFDLDLED